MKFFKNIGFMIMALTSFLYFYEHKDTLYNETVVLIKSFDKGIREVQKNYNKEKKSIDKAVKYVEEKKEDAKEYAEEISEKIDKK